MRTINGDMTTAEGSKFFDDPDIDGEGEVVPSSDEEPQINYSQRVPYGGDNIGILNDPILGSQGPNQLTMTQNTEAGLSYLSEMQLDQAVNRLFEDATTKKQKLERLQMEQQK